MKISVYNAKTAHDFRENTDAVEDVLKAVNGRATSYAITTFYDVMKIARDVEHDMDMTNVSDDARTGARYVYVPRTGRQHNGSVVTTRIVIERDADGVWSLVSASRVEARGKSGLAELTLAVAA